MNLQQQIIKLHDFNEESFKKFFKKYGYQLDRIIGIAVYTGINDYVFFVKCINSNNQLRFIRIKFDEQNKLVPITWKKEEIPASEAMKIFQKLVPSAKSGNSAFKMMLVWGSAK